MGAEGAVAEEALVVILARPLAEAAGAGPENKEKSPEPAVAEETKNEAEEKDTDAKMAVLRFNRRSDEITRAGGEVELRDGLLLLLLFRIGESSAAIREGVFTSGTAALKAIPATQPCRTNRSSSK